MNYTFLCCAYLSIMKANVAFFKISLVALFRAVFCISAKTTGRKQMKQFSNKEASTSEQLFPDISYYVNSLIYDPKIIKRFESDDIDGFEQRHTQSSKNVYTYIYIVSAI